MLGINYATFYRKMNGTSDFTREEVHRITKILGLSMSQMEEIFFED